jgi:hypothetical protein
MFNPTMFGATPQQMQKMREMGTRLRVEIRKCPREGRLEVRYVPINPQDQEAIQFTAQIIDGWATQFAYIHDSVFGMKGEITHVE